MKTRLSALVAGAALGAAAMSPALAHDGQSRFMSSSPYAPETTGSLYVDERGPTFLGCPVSSAADGNANQQTRPVMQYGQTAGGSSC
ncbi:hypothetical protein [Methylobacterium sp. Leaf112]|uniref:hypothetical protein n=1 Tax=Methylobacterium sp. Leaf112 TaxID=1736258 RepID=UPI0006F4E02B|nr:hypothetical protein [Methylobacterium sp. Leaf112]KQP64034.1 hypothetical protein ASF52_20295 [Methylobacterium sp. Leaf112]